MRIRIKTKDLCAVLIICILFIAFPAFCLLFGIIYAIYHAVKSLIKYNYDLKNQNQRKNPWED